MEVKDHKVVGSLIEEATQVLKPIVLIIVDFIPINIPLLTIPSQSIDGLSSTIGILRWIGVHYATRELMVNPVTSGLIKISCLELFDNLGNLDHWYDNSQAMGEYQDLESLLDPLSALHCPLVTTERLNQWVMFDFGSLVKFSQCKY